MLSATGGERAQGALRAGRRGPVARMLVLDSPALQPGTTVELKVPTRLGRGGENAIRLDGDDFVVDPPRHARAAPRRPLGRGRRLDERHVRQRRPRHDRTTPGAGRHRPDRPDRSQGGGVRTGRASALTDTGRRRPQNEDTFVCDPPLFAVADGVGGAQAGEIASRLAAAALEERRRRTLGEETLVGAAAARRTTGSTATRSTTRPRRGWERSSRPLLVDEAAGTVAIGHVGDSRAYRHPRRRARAADRPTTRSSASSSGRAALDARRPSSTRTDR